MLHKLLIGSLPLVPRPLMRFFAGKYIAGETLEEEISRLRKLAGEGYPGILDILGERSSTPALARAAAQDYIRAASAIVEAGLEAYISIKPTHLGLIVDEELALELYTEVAEHCRELGLFLRVEMEDHPTTDATLCIYEELHKNFERIGIVLQARLFRTLDDIDRLAAGPIDVRMVKGVYLEPESIAYTTPEAIRQAYLEATRKLLERGDVQLRLATHDKLMGRDLEQLLREYDLPRDRYEFQVLLGVQEPLWQRWRESGHVVRVYVPFGPEWREYSQRRLRKNPQLFRAVMRDLLPV